MKIAVYGQAYRTSSLNYIIQFIELLLDRQHEVFLVKSVHQIIKNQISTHVKTYSTSQPLAADIDYMISVGGDGTMLRASGIIQGSNTPVIGINTGRMGFLANVHKDKMNEALSDLEVKNFTINRRDLLTISIEKKENKQHIGYALNEVTLGRKNLASMITIKTTLNGEYLNTYWSDGLIISTSAGSTGYSLSCSGPIITPDVNAFVLTPIAPHNLNTRPLVINNNAKLTLEVQSRDSEFLMSMDSRIEVLPSNSTKVHICKADFSINMIELENHNFIHTLREKLLWGKDIRQ